MFVIQLKYEKQKLILKYLLTKKGFYKEYTYVSEIRWYAHCR